MRVPEKCECGKEADFESVYPHAEGVNACVSCYAEIGEEATKRFLERCKSQHWNEEEQKWKKGAALPKKRSKAKSKR
jgi:hypothetical protein